MSEKKKQVIHVKDLVIKADHVTLDQPEQGYDPFFGRRRPNPLFGPVREIREEESSESRSVESRSESGEESVERKTDPFFGPRRDALDNRERREFDPILGRPLKRQEESFNTTESSSSSSEKSSGDDK